MTMERQTEGTDTSHIPNDCCCNNHWVVPHKLGSVAVGYSQTVRYSMVVLSWGQKERSKLKSQGNLISSVGYYLVSSLPHSKDTLKQSQCYSHKTQVRETPVFVEQIRRVKN